jgi:hypothetical protein
MIIILSRYAGMIIGMARRMRHFFHLFSPLTGQSSDEIINLTRPHKSPRNLKKVTETLKEAII